MTIHRAGLFFFFHQNTQASFGTSHMRFSLISVLCFLGVAASAPTWPPNPVPGLSPPVESPPPSTSSRPVQLASSPVSAASGAGLSFSTPFSTPGLPPSSSPLHGAAGSRPENQPLTVYEKSQLTLNFANNFFYNTNHVSFFFLLPCYTLISYILGHSERSYSDSG